MHKIWTLLFLLFLSINVSFAEAEQNNNGGWVALDLDDTSTFDANCEYRYWTKGDVIYQTGIRPDALITKTSSGSGYITVVMNNNKKAYVFSPDGDYLHPKSVGGAIIKMEKRCTTPDSTPTGLVALFIGTPCPAGWQEWPISIDIKCASENCPSWEFCKKIS